MGVTTTNPTQVNQFPTLASTSAPVAMYGQVNTGIVQNGTTYWADIQVSLENVGSLAADAIGIGTIVPQAILGNAGTVAGAPSGLNLAQSLTLTPSGTIGVPGTISVHNLSGIALDGSTVLANTGTPHSVGSSFVSVTNTGTTPQVVQTPMTVAGRHVTQAGLDVGCVLTWNGGPSYANANTQLGGISGTQYLGGTVTNGTAAGSGLNNFLIEDSLKAGSGLCGFLIQHNTDNGTRSTNGGRAAMQMTTAINAPTGNGVGGVPPGQYSGLEVYAGASGNDNGTSGTASGTVFGANVIATIGGGATYYNGLVGIETGQGIDSTSSALANIGLHVTLGGQHANSGTQIDCAIGIDSGGSLGWAYGLQFNSTYKPSGFSAHSILIGSQAPGGTPVTITSGIDLTSGFTFTGNAIAVPGFSVPGQGLGPTTITNGLSANYISNSIGTFAAAGTSQATATVMTSQTCIITSGTGGVKLDFLNVGFVQDVSNQLTVTGTVYPPAGAQINNLGTVGYALLPPGANARFRFLSATQIYM